MSSPSEAVHRAATPARVPAAATGGRLTSLPGGLPIRISGQLVGGIGIGSGTGSQDIAVATAALRAVGAEAFEGLS